MILRCGLASNRHCPMPHPSIVGALRYNTAPPLSPPPRSLITPQPLPWLPTSSHACQWAPTRHRPTPLISVTVPAAMNPDSSGVDLHPVSALAVIARLPRRL
jgi:hypothetical protein